MEILIATSDCCWFRCQFFSGLLVDRRWVGVGWPQKVAFRKASGRDGWELRRQTSKHVLPLACLNIE